MNEKFTAPFGFKDSLPKTADAWRKVHNACDKVGDLYKFYLIETPVVENVGLLNKGLGDDKSVVTCRIGNENVAFRREGTVPVLRSYIEHQLGRFALPLRVAYRGPFFRKDGDLVQHHEHGFSIIGENLPFYDVEIILALVDVLRSLGFCDPVVHINTAGCRVCRPAYERKVKAHSERFGGKPVMLDHLCQLCNTHLQKVLEYLEHNDVNYTPELYLEGRFGYHNKTVFTITPSDDEKVLAAGGRYDYLAEHIGGRQIPAVGGSLFLDDLVPYVLAGMGALQERRNLFFAAVGDEAQKEGSRLMNMLRRNGFVVLEALGKKTLSAQLKAAEKSGALLTLIFGQKEVFEDVIILRNMTSGTQRNVPLDNMLNEVRKQFRG